MFNVVTENNQIIESSAFITCAQNIARRERDARGESISVFAEPGFFEDDEYGAVVFIAFANGTEWEEGEEPDDYDNYGADDYNEPYDPYDEVGYDPYTGGYDIDL